MSKPRVQTVPTPPNNCKVAHHGTVAGPPKGAPPNVTAPPDYLMSAPQNVVSGDGMMSITYSPARGTTVTERVPAAQYETRMRQLFPEQFAQPAPVEPHAAAPAAPSPPAPEPGEIGPEASASISVQAIGHARTLEYAGDFAVKAVMNGSAREIVPVDRNEGRRITFAADYIAKGLEYTVTVENLRSEPQRFSGVLTLDLGHGFDRIAIDSDPEWNGDLLPETSGKTPTTPPPDDSAPPAA